MYTLTDLFEGLQVFKAYTESNMIFKQTSFFGLIDPSIGSGFTAPTGSIYIRTNEDRTELLNFYLKESSLDTDWVAFVRAGIFDKAGVVSQVINATDLGFSGTCTGFINVRNVVGGSFVYYKLNITKSGFSPSAGIFTLATISSPTYLPPLNPVRTLISPSTHLVTLGDSSCCFNLTFSTNSLLQLPYPVGGDAFSFDYEGCALVPRDLSGMIT